MSWTANIVLKSTKNIIVESLVSINKKNTNDGSITKLEDFKSFYLSHNQLLSFVGEEQIVALNSNEIEYVELFKKN